MGLIDINTKKKRKNNYTTMIIFKVLPISQIFLLATKGFRMYRENANCLHKTFSIYFPNISDLF